VQAPAAQWAEKVGMDCLPYHNAYGVVGNAATCKEECLTQHPDCTAVIIWQDQCFFRNQPECGDKLEASPDHTVFLRLDGQQETAPQSVPVQSVQPVQVETGDGNLVASTAAPPATPAGAAVAGSSFCCFADEHSPKSQELCRTCTTSRKAAVDAYCAGSAAQCSECGQTTKWGTEWCVGQADVVMKDSSSATGHLLASRGSGISAALLVCAGAFAAAAAVAWRSGAAFRRRWHRYYNRVPGVAVQDVHGSRDIDVEGVAEGPLVPSLVA
jgi:hypothetical protein